VWITNHSTFWLNVIFLSETQFSAIGQINKDSRRFAWAIGEANAKLVKTKKALLIASEKCKNSVLINTSLNTAP
jgi:hypothetical protein